MADKAPASPATPAAPGIKERAASAGRRAMAKLKEEGAAKLKKLGGTLRESKNRRKVEAVEIMAGAVLAGAADGAGLSFNVGGTEVADPNEPSETITQGGVDVNLVGVAGVGGVVAGMAMKNPDVEAISFGAVTYTVGAMTRDFIQNMFEGDAGDDEGASTY